MGCRPVLSAANGPASARVMFVGEAPGRFGAGRTGVPFSGDASGTRFERLLGACGMSRDAVLITNAVLCLPLDQRGRNRTPSSSEVRACAGWLKETLDVVQPELVVALGRTGLEALRRLHPHTLELNDSNQRPADWNGRWLAARYHPGARSQVHRRWELQVEDWRRLGKWLRARGMLRG